MRLLNWEFMLKKMKERNIMENENELMIQKKCVACLKMALYNSADNNGKKMAIMKMTIVN